MARALEAYVVCSHFSTLPFSGGLMEQPNSVRVWFTIIRGAEAEHSKQEADKVQAK